MGMMNKMTMALTMLLLVLVAAVAGGEAKPAPTEKISGEFLDALAKTHRRLKDQEGQPKQPQPDPQQHGVKVRELQGTTFSFTQPQPGEPQDRGFTFQLIPNDNMTSTTNETMANDTMMMNGEDEQVMDVIYGEDPLDEATMEPTDELTPPKESLVPTPFPTTMVTPGTTMPTLSSAPTISAAPSPIPSTMEPTGIPWEPWMDSGVRTAFDFGTPFSFSYIFFIGGVCNGVAWDNWYSQWVKAGAATINVTDIICAEASEEDQNYVYTREFHLDALDTVVERVGDMLNETLVITVGVGLESDWTPVADLMKRGMAFFHCKEDPTNFFLEDYGLVPQETLYFYFRWDEETVAGVAGQELCRLKGGAQTLKVAQIWTANRNDSLNYRTTMALDAFEQFCPDTELQRVWSLYNDQQSAYRTTLLFNPIPDVILTTQDEIARDILAVAEQYLPEDQYNRMATTGWNNNGDLRELVVERKILTTVDQVVHYPNQGLWAIIKTVLDVVQESGFNSTYAIQDGLNLGESTTILADTLLVSSDNVGYLISNLLEGYDPDSPPKKEVKVSTGLHTTTITEMVPFDGKFQTVLWLKTSWVDPRLAWNPFVFDGRVTVDADRIWTPKLFFRNLFEDEDLYQSPASITSDGTVVLETNMQADFLCETDEDLRSFPFDSYTCSMDLGAPQGISLDQAFSFEIIGSDPHFYDQTTYYMEQDENYGDSGESSDRGNVAVFEIYFQRKQFTAWVRLVMPAILINIIGFISFWIPEVQESVALGVTSFLCALAFRETVEMPDTADITWSEVFVLVNVCYQASVLAVIWISYSKGGHFAKQLHDRLIVYHPWKVYKKAAPVQRAKMAFKESVLFSGNTGIKYTDTGLPENDFVVPMPDEHGLKPPNLSSRTISSRTDKMLSQRTISTMKVANQTFKETWELSGTTGIRYNEDGVPENDFVVPMPGAAEESRKKRPDFHRSLTDFTEFPIGPLEIPLRREARPDDDSDGEPELLPPDEDGHISPEEIERRLEELAVLSQHSLGMSHPSMAADDEPEKRSSLGLSGPSVGFAGMNLSNHKTTVTAATEKTKEELYREENLDFIGRWFIVPSYVIVTLTLLYGGWGFFD